MNQKVYVLTYYDEWAGDYKVMGVYKSMFKASAEKDRLISEGGGDEEDLGGGFIISVHVVE